jgi:hypothetical protein
VRPRFDARSGAEPAADPGSQGHVPSANPRLLQALTLDPVSTDNAKLVILSDAYTHKINSLITADDDRLTAELCDLFVTESLEHRTAQPTR